jgi:hypothetical protein
VAEGASVNEADWQRQVTDLADLLGWTWVHFRPARTENGWRTPVSGSLGVGWVDLVLVRERVVYAELKADRGTISGVQHAVHAALRAAGCEVHIWRPRDFSEVKAVLERRAA